MGEPAHAEVKRLFLAAVDLDTAERPQFLQRSCGNDARLRAEVETLLSHHDTVTILPDAAPVGETNGTAQPPLMVQPQLDGRSDGQDWLLLAADDPRVADETRLLRRNRLTAVTVVLCGGLGFLLVAKLLSSRLWELQIQSLELLVVGGCLALLASSWKFSDAQLRLVEMTVFGTISLVTVAIHVLLMAEDAADGDLADTVRANDWHYLAWSLIIFMYGTFMPNRWQHAAALLLPAACVPYLITFFVCQWNADVATMLSEDRYGTLLPAPFLAAFASIYAAHTIHSARLDAIRARRIAQYHLRDLLGVGGMGEVYEAEHLLLKRPCAIKLIRRDCSADPHLLARFEREVKSAAQLSHPNTIEVFDYGRTAEGLFYYVMELLPGCSLAKLVAGDGPLPAGRVVYLLRQCCGALREAHEAGLIHRDLKPANIFAAQRGGMYDVAKLLDFGVVRLTHDDSDLTSMFSIIGTPSYMAPEQASSSRRADARSDIYSLGAVAYFLLTGQPPFAGDSPVDVLAQHAAAPAPPPSQICAEVPADLEAIVLRCLEKQPDQRYPSAASLDHALSQCQCASAWSPEQAQAWWTKREAGEQHAP